MSFLSSETLHNIISELIQGSDPNNIKHGAYELRLGSEYFTTDSKKGTKSIEQKNKQILIRPGQFAFLITEEQINLSAKYIGFISMKFSLKQRGLINISGFHVDPGFKGCLKFSVYNAGSQNIILTVGKPLFLIWFATLDKETDDLYKGSHQNKNNISNTDVMNIQGEIASPNYLNSQVKKIKRELNVLRALIMGIVIVILGNYISSGSNNGSSENKSSSYDAKQNLFQDSSNTVDTTKLLK